MYILGESNHQRHASFEQIMQIEECSLWFVVYSLVSMHVDAYHLCSQNIILLYWYFLHNHNSLTPITYSPTYLRVKCVFIWGQHWGKLLSRRSTLVVLMKVEMERMK